MQAPGRYAFVAMDGAVVLRRCKDLSCGLERAGALMLAHAEAIAGITLARITRKGAPVVYGSFTSNVDMKSGAPAFGTPEYTKAAIGAGQLARYIGIPWRSSNATAANSVDAQAAYESQMSIWGAALGGCNVLHHGAGWLEGGLAASYEKFIVNIEMLQMLAEFCQPVAVSAAELGLDAIAEAGKQVLGPYLWHGAYHGAVSKCLLRPFAVRLAQLWLLEEDGAKSAEIRANAIWKKVLSEFLPPDRDPAVIEYLNAYIEKRTAEGGAPPVS
jgi:trimethylamine---corrinoid protein Co-methyltransferase